MSYLLVDTLDAERSQPFELSTPQRVTVASVSLWVLAYDLGDSDTVRFRIKRDGSTLAEVTRTGAQIKSAIGCTDTYGHGKLQIDFGALQLERGTYSVTAEQLTGYGTDNYLGWCREWETQFLPQDEATSGLSDPYYVRVYDYKGASI